MGRKLCKREETAVLFRQTVLLECVSVTDDVRGEGVMRELILTCLLSSGWCEARE